ncbi:MAG: 16S rRNA (guanine(527)-N(7))-methyltransferase RsmG [bacterium]|nr:16S rRNA (guanine(527)-N(7))-methyltransferase RsmG [bacterium]
MQQIDRIKTYTDLLKDYNETINIYSKSSYDKLNFHILDSINIANLISNKPYRVVDFGSGSGLPAVIISIINPQNKVQAFESKQKKCTFLEKVKKALDLKNLQIVNRNIYEYKLKHDLTADFYTAKAFAAPEKVTRLASSVAKTKAGLIIPVSKKQYLSLKNTLYPFKIIESNDTLFYYLHKTLTVT